MTYTSNKRRNPIVTLEVTNWGGSMTEFTNGPINSGKSNMFESFGADPFAFPNNLTWSENQVQIDTAGAVITDLIMAGKERVESGVIYNYTIGHTGRLYKIQVNDPTTYNPDYDNPVLLATLTLGSPTFTRGGFLDFYGSTEKIYIGHDKGVTSINFDGSGEAVVGLLASWTQNVPRPLKQFIGNLYVGNGSNIAEIGVTAIVNTYTKLSPGFPNNTQVRDLDVSADGTYLHATVNRNALPDITQPTQDITTSATADSYIFKWNGTDTGYTSYDTFPLVSLVSNYIFGQRQYTFGYDIRGSSIYNPTERIIESGFNSSFEDGPYPNAIISDGSMVGWACPLYFGGHLSLSYCCYGPLNFEVGTGYWSPFGMNATGTETDIVRVPYFQSVTNLGRGPANNNYANNVFSTSKMYFSTLESSATTTKYKFYRWRPVSTGSGTAITGGLYQTQTQLFSKKVRLSEIRVYGEPWAAGVAFTIDIIGSDGNPISGASKTFTAGGNLAIGADYAWYTPQAAPTFAIGLRVTQAGTVNHTIDKVEIDYDVGGK